MTMWIFWSPKILSLSASYNFTLLIISNSVYSWESFKFKELWMFFPHPTPNAQSYLHRGQLCLLILVFPSGNFQCIHKYLHISCFFLNHKWDHIIYTVLQLHFFPINISWTSFLSPLIDSSHVFKWWQRILFTIIYLISLLNVHHYNFHFQFYMISNNATINILVYITLHTLCE